MKDDQLKCWRCGEPPVPHCRACGLELAPDDPKAPLILKEAHAEGVAHGRENPHREIVAVARFRADTGRMSWEVRPLASGAVAVSVTEHRGGAPIRMFPSGEQAGAFILGHQAGRAEA